MVMCEGICVGGPLDGKRLSHVIKHFEMAILEPIGTIHAYKESQVTQKIVDVKKFHYVFERFCGVGLWFNPDDNPEMVMVRLVASYRPAVKR